MQKIWIRVRKNSLLLHVFCLEVAEDSKLKINYEHHGLSINMNKTEYLVFRGDNIISDLPSKIKNIERVTTAKYLDVVLHKTPRNQKQDWKKRKCYKNFDFNFMEETYYKTNNETKKTTKEKYDIWWGRNIDYQQ